MNVKVQELTCANYVHLPPVPFPQVTSRIMDQASNRHQQKRTDVTRAADEIGVGGVVVAVTCGVGTGVVAPFKQDEYALAIEGAKVPFTVA